MVIYKSVPLKGALKTGALKTAIKLLSQQELSTMRASKTAALCLLLSGCGTHPPLKTSLDSTAIIEFSDESGRAPLVAAVFRDDYDCFGFTGVPASSKWKVDVSASRPYQTVFVGYGGVKAGGSGLVSSSCGGAYTFKTDGSSRYVVRASFDGEKCRFMVTSTNSLESLHISRREWITPLFDKSGPWCKAEDSYRGSSDYETPR